MAVFGGSRGGIVGSITNTISNAVDSAKSTASKVYNSASGGYHTVTRYVDRFYTHLKEELSGVTSYFQGSYDSIKDAANSAWHNSVDAVQKPDGIFNTALSKAQAMSTAAVDKLNNMTDLVKALTNWTIGFVIGLTQGFFATLKYGFEKGFAPLKGFFHASAAGAYETMIQIGYIPVNAFNSFWSGLNNASGAFGPLAPLFVAIVVFSLMAAVVWFAKTGPPWILERLYELL